MKNFSATITFLFLLISTTLCAQQLPNSQFEDWSGPEFKNAIQPASWHYSNVEQLGVKFNFSHRETGHNGGYCMMVQDQALEVAGIGETSPGYIALGQPWVYIESLGKVSEATAGTYGGIAWTARPDTMAVWIKRTGSAALNEDFHLLYYAWRGTAHGDKYKGKNGKCTEVSWDDEESDIRQSTNGNECGTTTSVNQIAEGWVFGRKVYNDWTLIKVPIYYNDNDQPEKINVIFSAGNYPNFRANDGLNAGNSLYVDDVTLIYSSKIQQLYIDGTEWKNFNPNSTAIQTYVLGDAAYAIPSIKAFRGVGQLTNTRGTVVSYLGRQLQGSEISITEGVIDETPTLITVKAEDGSSETTYRIMFAHKASKNVCLSGIKVNGKLVSNYNPYITDYTAEVEYGSSAAPIVSVEKQEEQQTVTFTQPTSINDVTTIYVTAADGVTKGTYTLRYKEAPLSDNTLVDIKVNGNSLPDFMPTKTTYNKVSIPLGTTEMPTVEAISKYAQGLQKIVMTPPSVIDGGTYQIAVSTPGNPTAKVYKLTFKIEPSSYCKLKNIFLDGVALSNFSPDNTTYSIPLPIGTSSLPQITYTHGDAYQTIELISGGLDGTTRIIVTAANGDKLTYKLAFSTAKSTISTLNGIKLDGEMISGFDPAITTYTIQLPIGTTQLPNIEVLPADEYETYSIMRGSLNGTTRITVQAGNGNTTIYQIIFSVAQATNATLKDITIGGVVLENFNPSILEYTYILPQGTTELPIISYTPYDQYQTITSRSNGVNGDYKITVRPQSGASQTYIIHFSVPKADNADLQMIYLNNLPLTGFTYNLYNYTDTLNANNLPTVTYLGNDGQRYISYLDDNVYVIKVTAESGKSNTYTIKFVVRVSESASLKMIYLNGDSLNGFTPEQLTYKNIALNGSTCPTISVESEEGQQVTILSPTGAGKADIIVTSTSGTNNTYQLEFVDTTLAPVPVLEPVVEYIPSTDATLQTIWADGIALHDFEATKDEYTIVLAPGQQDPAIVFEPKNNLQSLISGRIAEHQYQAIVTAEDGIHSIIYKVTIQPTLDNNALLNNLQVEGKALAFNPNQFTYQLQLDNGQSLPDIHYEAAYGQTVMVYAQNDTTQQVLVTAQDGTQNTYVISYTRVRSNNAYLSNIYIGDQSLNGFNKNTFNYTYILPFRTTVVPAVNPIGEVDGQTITTYFSSVKGTTYIHVVAEDGVSSSTYSIAFPTEPSEYVALGDLRLEAEYTIADLKFDPEQTEYTVLIPFGEDIAPKIVFEKGEKEQIVTSIARPIGQTSEVIVKAENGDQRIYKLKMERDKAPKENILQSITIAELKAALDMTDVNQREFDVQLPYGAVNMTVSYVKNYNEQTVLVQPGGLTRPTILTVLSNNGVQPTATYTLHPIINTQNPAILTSITIDGTPLTNFEPNRFSYIVNRANFSNVEVNVTHDADVQVSKLTTQYSSIITATAGDYTNTYRIFFHYTNDTIPNGEFTQWTKTSKSNTDKPTGWCVPGDYLGSYASTTHAGSEIAISGTSVVHLSTTYWAALGGAIPAIMNLGGLNAEFRVAGNTSVAPTGNTIPFHNTPDYALLNYKYSTKKGDGALFSFNFVDDQNSPHHTQFTSDKTSSYVDYIVALGTDGLNIQSMDIMVNATNQTTKTSSGASLYVDYIRFAYSNTLKGLTVNDLPATLNDHAFAVELNKSEDAALPKLIFQQEVSDQAQRITWNVPYREGDYSIRKASITNYGEDGSSADYTLEVKRPLDANVALRGIQIGGKNFKEFKMNELTYTYHLSYGTTVFPDIVPALCNSLQQCQTTLTDSTVTMVVTSEKGSQRSYTIRFVVGDEPNAQLKSISHVEDFKSDTYEYTIVADEWPEITYEKMYDAQVVTMSEGIIDVAADDNTRKRYIIHLQPATIPSTLGQLTEMELDGELLTSFTADKYLYELPRPQLVAFTRSNATDSVVYTQYPDSLTWQVYGTQTHTYVLTPIASVNTSTNLKGIYIDGKLIEGFNASLTDYTILTDTAIALTAEGVSTHQTIDIEHSNNIYTITVTAQNGTTGTPYTVTILPLTTANAMLQAIYLDGEMITNFDSKITTYDITLPANSYKEQEPALPKLTYLPYDCKATVDVAANGLGDTTRLYVTSSDGTVSQTYQLIFSAEPSHNAQLSAIAVNNLPIADFEPNRMYYSAQVAPGDNTIEWRSKDRFQSVNIDTIAFDKYRLHVVAQDQTTSNDYEIEFFEKTLSNDATLKDIQIDGNAMETYRPDLNKDLRFNAGLNKYIINIPNNLMNLPQIAIHRKLDGQLTSMRQEDHTIFIDVTAPDGIGTNTYTLQFVRTLSSNTSLKGFYLNGEMYEAYQEDQHFYFIDLPSGQHTTPDIFPIKAENAQQWDSSIVSLSIGDQISITVTAEDQINQSQYILLFQKHPSTADSLTQIYADEVEIEGFNSQVFNYHYYLPYVEGYSFPSLSWDAADEYQTVRIDTTEQTELSLTRQIVVTAESGLRNRYTITYTMLQSNNTTLSMILVNGTDSLPGFDPFTTEYIYTLPVGTQQVPTLIAMESDATQTIIVKKDSSSLIANALSAIQFEVIAQNGDKRIYTISMVVTPDTTATLSMIAYNDKPVPRYDELTLNYVISLTKEESQLPLITFTKHSEKQVVDILIADSNRVQLRVTADDGKSQATYTLTFMPYMSDNGLLNGIYLNDSLLTGYNPYQDAYEITLDSLSFMPEITFELAEPTQQVVITTEYRYTADSLIYDVIKVLKVVPENQEDTAIYELIFHIKENTPLRPEESENANLISICVRGQLISREIGFDVDFMPDTTNYHMIYPIGSDPEIFFADTDLIALTQDSLARIVSYNTEVIKTVMDTAGVDVLVSSCIHIVVLAAGGNTTTYNIYQELILDSLNHVTDLIVADYQGVMRSLNEFDKDVFYYEYTLSDTKTNAPDFTLTYANTSSRFAYVSFERANNSRIVDADDDTNYAMDNSENDPTYHICYRAENGTKYVYKIKFIRTDIKRAQKPMEGDVLIQHIPGTNQIAVASLRANVVFALYDMAGHMINLTKLEEGNPNSFATTTDGFGQTYFGHLTDYSSCTILTLETSKIYFWAFTENGKRKIKSGKIVILP